MKRVIITIMSMMLAVFFASAQNWVKVDRELFYDLKKTPFSKIKMKEGDKGKLWYERGNRGVNALVMFSDQPDVQSGDYRADAFLVTITIDDKTIDKNDKGFTKTSDGWYEYDFGKTLYVSDIGRDVGTTNFCNPIYILPQKPSEITTPKVPTFEDILSKAEKELREDVNGVLILDFTDLDSYREKRNIYKEDSIRGFAGRNDIKRLIIKANESLLSPNAFEGCNNLKSIEILGHKKIYIGARAFENCKNLEKVELLGREELQIGASAFENCEKLAKVLMTYNGYDTSRKLWISYHEKIFKNCINLKELIFSKNISWEYSNWSEDYKLQNRSALEGCINLEKVVEGDEIMFPADFFNLPSGGIDNPDVIDIIKTPYACYGKWLSHKEIPRCPYTASFFARVEKDAAENNKLKQTQQAATGKAINEATQFLTVLRKKHGVMNIVPGGLEGVIPKEGVPIQFYKDIVAKKSIFSAIITGPFMLNTSEALNFGSGTKRYRYGGSIQWDLYVKNGKVVFVKKGGIISVEDLLNAYFGN